LNYGRKINAVKITKMFYTDKQIYYPKSMVWTE